MPLQNGGKQHCFRTRVQKVGQLVFDRIPSIPRSGKLLTIGIARHNVPYRHHSNGLHQNHTIIAESLKQH